MWEYGKFSILTGEGMEVVDGIMHINHALGIHSDENGYFAVTHLATGRRIGPSVYPKNFAGALEFVERIGPYADWADENVIAESDDDLKRKVHKARWQCLGDTM